MVMSLPYRFQAGGSGGMPDSGSSGFHHRSTTKNEHKPFKSRFTSKGALKDKAKGSVCPHVRCSLLTATLGKIEDHREERGKRRTTYQQAMSKLARRNQAKQIRSNHTEKRTAESSIFQGLHGVPKHIAVVPLSSSAKPEAVVKVLNDSVGESEDADGTRLRVQVTRFRRNLQYMPTSRDLLDVLDTCQLADWVILVLTTDQDFGDYEDQLLRSLEGQGVTNIVAVVQDSGQIPVAAKRVKVVFQQKLALCRYFASLDKIHILDSKSDCSNLVRSFCTASTRGIRWRDARSWLRVDEHRWHDADEATGTADVTISGVVRGQNLNIDRVVHVPRWGDFQIRKAFEIPDHNKQHRNGDTLTDVNPREWLPSGDRDDLHELAPEDGMEDAPSTVSAGHERKGVLLDDDRYFEDGNEDEEDTPVRLPKGTSSYQAAWYLDDMSDSESDIAGEDEEDLGGRMEDLTVAGPEDGAVMANGDAMTEAPASEAADTEMHIEVGKEEEAKQLADYRQQRKKLALEDLEFPDEIELHPNVLARDRLAKYRGLRNLRTSPWNANEDAPYEPEEHKRVLQVADYKSSRSAAMKEVLAGGIVAGTHVEVRLRDVPVALKAIATPTALFSLLRHERKHAVINLNMTLASDVVDPVKSKEELIVQIGLRRLVVNPVFSASGTTPNDLHKFDRYLHPGRTVTATFIGPLTWGTVPVLVFRRGSASQNGPMSVDEDMTGRNPSSTTDLRLIGTATTTPQTNSRTVVKRVILTGHALKINKKLVTIRYMFFNREDVVWFAALPLWTKRGRQGFMKEPLGTHGYFKATFDGKINPMDAVGISLYKRVWPRTSRLWVQ